MEMTMYHKPVLLNSSVEELITSPDGVYVDTTFGGGGHSAQILKRLSPDGKLYAFDQDPDARHNAPQDHRFQLISANFRYLEKNLRFYGVQAVDGLHADLGISSHQIDEGERGFSIRYDARLDMRMNPETQLSAYEVINNYASEELIRVFREYGELKNARPLARKIEEERAKESIETTFGLMRVLEKLAPRQKPSQFWARLFQAIRIEVNQEMEALRDLLQQATQILTPGGRISVISYHSLEDRLVKNFFRYGNFEGTPEKDFYGNLLRPLEPVNKKPIVPEAEEISENSRARSAKLRIAQRHE